MEEQAFKIDSLEVRYIHSEKANSVWHSTTHDHLFTELFFITAGGGVFQVADEVFTVKTGDIVIINPSVPHTERRDEKNSPFNYIVIGLEGVEFIKQNGVHTAYQLFNMSKPKDNLDGCLTELLNEYKWHDENDKYRQDIVRRYLEILLLKIMRSTRVSIKEYIPPKIRQTCINIRQYIDNNLNSAKLSLDELANMFHLNKYYLVHTFTKEFNISPIHYINSRRIQESQQLLANTNYSVSLIAELNGFSSASYFSQSFQRAVEMSPMQYRKMMQAGKESKR